MYFSLNNGGTTKKCFRYLKSLKLNERDQFADHGIDGRIILTCIVDEV
jgi:hypothetical protein